MIPRKPTKGDPLDFSSQSQGDVIDAVEVLRTEQFSQLPGDQWQDTKPLGNVIKVSNTSGYNVPWYGIVELGNSIHDPNTDEDGFKNGVLFSITQPSSDDDKIIGIAQEPINQGEVGDVMLVGVTQVRVQVTEDTEDLTFAKKIIGDNFKLEVSSIGPVKILWKETRTSDPENVWAIVKLKSEGEDYDRCNALLKGDLIGSGSETVDNVVATRGGSPLDDPDDVTEELTVNNSMFEWDGDDNAPCKIEYNHIDEQWEFYQVKCPA